MLCSCRRFRAVALISLSSLCACAVAQAQSKPARVEPERAAASFGTVSGHVYIAGSNAPARLIQVALQPIEIKTDAEPTPGKMQPANFTVYRTGLDGSFLINRVAPGTYYIVTKDPGFLSPFSQFTLAELQHPATEVAQRMTATLPVISVRPNATATVNVVLGRGASLGGVVRFDDGTPFPNASVSIIRRGSDGKWAEPRGMDANGNTDGDGRWEIGGLPPGDYKAKVTLNIEERHQSSLLSDNTSMWVTFGYNLPVYVGDTVRESQAKISTLTDNQQLDAQDITIPTSKLHSLSGAVVDKGTGQALNGGHVTLVYADDGTEVASANVDADTRSYTFPFILEGEYKLVAKDAKEVRFEQTGSAEDDPFHQNRKEIVLRQYAPGEMPLILQGELSSVNLPVEARAAKAQ